jgi:hypothetical protein
MNATHNYRIHDNAARVDPANIPIPVGSKLADEYMG